MASMRQDGGGTGVDISGHLSGDPFPGGELSAGANVTVAHTWIIIVLAVGLLWLLGGGVFRKIRI